ncbi:unnamed protein product [Merluccius merluccius]
MRLICTILDNQKVVGSKGKEVRSGPGATPHRGSRSPHSERYVVLCGAALALCGSSVRTPTQADIISAVFWFALVPRE